MATQRADMSPKTKRLGIFPHSIRRFVIVFMIILFLIGGIIGIIGIWQGWGIVSNVVFLIFAVASVILGILTFWPSNSSNEAHVPVSPVPPQTTPVQVNIYNNPGQPASPQHVPTPLRNNTNNNQPADPNAAINTSAANLQQPSNNMPGVQTPIPPVTAPSPSVQRDELPQLDRDDLLDALTNCLAVCRRERSRGLASHSSGARPSQ